MRVAVYFFIVLAVHNHLWAQTNYVATTPNSTTPGQDNIIIGPQSGNTTMSGAGNAIMGYWAGRNLTTNVEAETG